MNSSGDTGDTVAKWKSRKGLVASLATLAMLMLMLPAASPLAAQGTQTYAEGPDYNFSQTTYDIGFGPRTVRVNWNLYGGPTDLPYWIHTDVVAAGFEQAVRAAFQTFEDDPTSDISFVYMGTTSTLSEIVFNPGTGRYTQATDNVNVVSFRALPAPLGGRGGLSGQFDVDTNSFPTGTGDGHFDISLSNTQAFSIGRQVGAVDVETIVLHELGHALGLGHAGTNSSAVMWDVVATNSTKRALRGADRAALAVIYPASTPTPAPSTKRCDNKFVTVDLSLNQQPTNGADVILGTTGDDVINALGGNDVICALGGNDRISTGSGNNRVFAGGGNDIINGGSGKDLIRGGNGNDVINGRGGNDNLNGNNGNDTVNGGDGHDYVSGRDGRDTVTGGAGNDTVNGGGKSDILKGGEGNDTLNGNGFADQIFGGRGDDILIGGDGPDHLRGEQGEDQLTGSRGNDILWGGNGNDSCNGKTGFDTQVNCESRVEIP